MEAEAAGESSQPLGGSSASGCRGTGTAGGSAGGSPVQGSNGGRTWQIGGQEERRSVESNCDRLCPTLQDLCLLLPLGEFAVEHRTEPKGLARLPVSNVVVGPTVGSRKDHRPWLTGLSVAPVGTEA